MTDTPQPDTVESSFPIRWEDIFRFDDKYIDHPLAKDIIAALEFLENIPEGQARFRKIYNTEIAGKEARLGDDMRVIISMEDDRTGVPPHMNNYPNRVNFAPSDPEQITFYDFNSESIVNAQLIEMVVHEIDHVARRIEMNSYLQRDPDKTAAENVLATRDAFMGEEEAANDFADRVFAKYCQNPTQRGDYFLVNFDVSEEDILNGVGFPTGLTNGFETDNEGTAERLQTLDTYKHLQDINFSQFIGADGALIVSENPMDCSNSEVGTLPSPTTEQTPASTPQPGKADNTLISK